jgi:hypothetical protein
MRPPLTGTKPAFVGSITQSASVFPIPKTIKIKESRDLQSYSYIESEPIEHTLMITHASKKNCENPSSFQRAQQAVELPSRWLESNKWGAWGQVFV